MFLFVYVTHGAQMDTKLFLRAVQARHDNSLVVTARYTKGSLQIVCGPSIDKIFTDGMYEGLSSQADLDGLLKGLKTHYNLSTEDVFFYCEANLGVCGGGEQITQTALSYIQMVAPRAVVFFTETARCRDNARSWIEKHHFKFHPRLNSITMSTENDDVLESFSLSSQLLTDTTRTTVSFPALTLDLEILPFFAVVAKSQCLSTTTMITDITEPAVLKLSSKPQKLISEKTTSSRSCFSFFQLIFCCRRDDTQVTPSL